MLFSQFSDYLQKLESKSSRLEMTQILADLFVKLDKKELKPACYLMQGRLVPLYKSLEFNLSEKMILKSLARLLDNQADEGKSTNLFGEKDFSVLEKEVKQKYKTVGDLGQLTAEILDENKNSNLEIIDVFHQLTQIAKYQGSGSQEQKINKLTKLLKSLSPISAKYTVRVIIGKMRLGFSNMTMIDALSWAVVGDKSESKLLESVYNKKADIGLLAENYLELKELKPEVRSKKLAELKVEVMVPVVPALCQRLNTAQEMIEKMGEVIIEPKYDGMRIQIHFFRKNDGVEVKAYTRNLEDVSYSLPELEDLQYRTQASSLILDAEAIGYDPQSGELLPFQQTITRRRKYNVEEKSGEVPIRFYIFDVLELDNQSLISKSLRERKELLKGLIKENETFKLTPFQITEDQNTIRTYHEQQLAKGLEGVVVKKVDSGYDSGRKGWSWVKMKEEEGTSGKLSDTLDLIVMGYYLGKGKRANLGMGAILVGVIKEEKIFTVAKIGTGLTDKLLKQLTIDCQKIKVDKKPTQYNVPKELTPDVWVEPRMIVEIAADEITHSPLHSAELALRFPRLIKIRDDKDWSQATNIDELRVIGGLG